MDFPQFRTLFHVINAKNTDFYVSLQDKHIKLHGRFFIDGGQCNRQPRQQFD